MLDRKIFIAILILMTMFVISLKNKPENFSLDESTKIKKLENMITGLNDSFNSTINILSKQKFKGFEGPKGDTGEMGPIGGNSLSYQTLINLSKPGHYANITNGNGKYAKLFMAKKQNPLSEFAISEQMFQYTNDKQIKPKNNNNNCLTYKDNGVYMDTCSKNVSLNQKWNFDNDKLVPQGDEGKCLTLSSMENNHITKGLGSNDIFKNGNIDELILASCPKGSNLEQQRWNLR